MTHSGRMGSVQGESPICCSDRRASSEWKHSRSESVIQLVTDADQQALGASSGQDIMIAPGLHEIDFMHLTAQ
jgi:hypothetical protein